MKPALRDNVRHLSRKLQHQLGEQQLPADLLQPGHIDTKFAGHVGFPEAGDSIAYEPVQSLLAVGGRRVGVAAGGRGGEAACLRRRNIGRLFLYDAPHNMGTGPGVAASHRRTAGGQAAAQREPRTRRRRRWARRTAA